MLINYAHEDFQNWILAETIFDPAQLRKMETVFCLGNGYMGLRGATEERYLHESRGWYLAGVFDRFPGEVAELANLPDWLGVTLHINGEPLTLEKGRILRYLRYVNLQHGELRRIVEWETLRGEQVRLVFTRFVSLHNLHLAGLSVQIVPLNCPLQLDITSGLNGQMTNSGVQHLIEGDTRVFPQTQRYYMTAATQESNIDIAIAAQHRFVLNGNSLLPNERFHVARRQLLLTSTWKLESEDSLVFEKIIDVWTSRDNEFHARAVNKVEVIQAALDDLERDGESGYAELFAQSQAFWQQQWAAMGIALDGPDFDQFAIRFAQFHLRQMTPMHDNRVSIGAKGLSGEGYKGHVFWDTDIFMFPFLLYSFPEAARKMIEYRYNTLNGARRNAEAHGYQGALYAWESTLTGEEATPKWWGIDLLRGTPNRVWGSELKLHITADVIYALWQYAQAASNDELMVQAGYEMLFETANFWVSRLEWNQIHGHYELTDVMGPDEYGEHVNNNAYTNYLAHWHLRWAVECAQWLKGRHPEIWQSLNERLDLERQQPLWQIRAEKLYLPLDAATGIIPQDDEFFSKRALDMTPYRGKVDGIFQQLSWAEITSSQVIKQADVVMLLYLLDAHFSQTIKQANWQCYEPKTLHDSSLSPAIHAILANDIGETTLAYRYFEQACRIDLGDDSHRADQGMHAAALGGIWQAVVNGFAGVRIRQGCLAFAPRLPEVWSRLAFRLHWKGDVIAVTLNQQRLTLRKETTHNASLAIEVAGQKYELTDEGLSIAL